MATEQAPPAATQDRGETVVSPPARGTRRAETIRLDLTWRMIGKILLVLALLWLLYQLRSFLLTFVIALMLTAAFAPPVGRLQRRGLPRSAAVAIVFLVFILCVAGILLLLIPPLVDESKDLYKRLPSLVERTRGILQSRYPSLYQRLQDFANREAQGGSLHIPVSVPTLLSVGVGIVSGIGDFVVALVMTAYLLLDGQRVYRWCVRYLPDKQEAKVRQALPEISHVVSGYLAGQVLTSLMFGIFSFLLLTALNVPQAIFLAVLAAVMDAIPIVGVAIATVPAALLALTQSFTTAIIVVAAYIAYQQLENHVIVPKIYSETLKVSSFAVLIAVAIGGELLGIIGVLLALPIAAAIPVVERIWIGERVVSNNGTSPPAATADGKSPE
jgi:predicted PurR-regulated permease PerM